MLIRTLFEPEPKSEIKAAAKSVARWTHNNFSAAGFSEWQAKQGAKGGKISKRKSVESSERTIKPWVKLGIHRATYYRKKAKGLF